MDFSDISYCFRNEFVNAKDSTVLPGLIIPALNPPASLVIFCRDIVAAGAVSGIVLVDDGSKDRAVFSTCAQLEQVYVIHHDENKGRGAALQTGYKHAKKSFVHATGFLTADADGQHLAADVVKIARALAIDSKHLHLGVRLFTGRIPLKSRIGNMFSSWF